MTHKACFDNFHKKVSETLTGDRVDKGCDFMCDFFLDFEEALRYIESFDDFENHKKVYEVMFFDM